MATSEAPGPTGNPARHRPLSALEAGLAALPPAPTDKGRVALIVSRRADGLRETLLRIELTPGGGVPGDRWGRREPCDPAMQIAVMERAVAELIAAGQDCTIFGDNLLVDLDLRRENLPPGSRLRVGAAVCEVTPMPHNGCVKFRGRFGGDALRFVSDEALRHRNLRGIYWRCVEPGAVAVGDAIEVLARAT